MLHAALRSLTESYSGYRLIINKNIFKTVDIIAAAIAAVFFDGRRGRRVIRRAYIFSSSSIVVPDLGQLCSR